MASAKRKAAGRKAARTRKRNKDKHPIEFWDCGGPKMEFGRINYIKTCVRK